MQGGSLPWYKPLTPLSFLCRIAYVMPDKTAVIGGEPTDIFLLDGQFISAYSKDWLYTM